MPKDTYLEGRILTADPVELVHILYEHAQAQVRAARTARETNDIRGVGQAICKALGALGELEASLNHDAGGAISRNLARLYQYMRKRLTDANMKKDTAALTEVESLVRTLDEGWLAMRRSTAVPAASTYAFAAAESLEHAWSA